MSLNELLEEIFDTDVISLEDYMNRINEVENFFLNNGNSDGKLIIEEINSVAKRKVISSALAILKKRGRNSKNGKSVIWIFVISMMMSS